MNTRLVPAVVVVLGILSGCSGDENATENDASLSNDTGEPEIGPPVISQLEYPATELVYPAEEVAEE